jgi:hypothetical protein
VPRRASLVLVLALLGVTATAFAVTERLKLEPVPVEATRVDTVFSPVCNCPQDRAAVQLRVRRTDHLTLLVLNANGKKVRELAHDLRIGKGLANFAWDGRDENGNRVPDGTYRVRLELRHEGRTINLPRRIVVDTVAPVARLVSYSPHVLRRSNGPRVLVRYRLSQPAHAVLFVNDRRQVRTGSSKTSGAFQWFARVDGKRLPPGKYRLRLAGLDDAGNLGPRTPAFVLRVR